MPINKVVIMVPGRIGRRIPLLTAHLHFCETKPCMVNIPPTKNNILESIIEQKSFEITPNLRLIDFKNFKSLTNIYKEVQHRYYPEKDVLVKKGAE